MAKDRSWIYEREEEELKSIPVILGHDLKKPRREYVLSIAEELEELRNRGIRDDLLEDSAGHK